MNGQRACGSGVEGPSELTPVPRLFDWRGILAGLENPDFRKSPC
jgi:hypothetical protein